MAGPDFGLLQGGMQLNPNAFGAGLSQGAGLVQLQQAAQDRQTAMAEKQAAIEAAKAKAIEDAKRNMYQMQRFAEVAAKPSLRGLTQLGVEFPQAIEQMKKAHEMLSAEQKAANIGVAQRTFAAMESGQPKIAVETLRRAAEARRAEGDEEAAKNFEANADLIASAKSEGAAYVAVGSFLQSVMGPDDFVSKFGELKRQPADLAKAQAEADIKATQAKLEGEKIMAEIALDKANTARLYNLTRLDGERLGIDKDRLRIEAAKELREAGGAGGLSPASQKMVTEAAVDAATAAVESKSIGEISALFGKDKAPLLDGGASAAGRFVGGQLGFSTEEQRAREKYGALVEKMVSADLKGLGNATDADRASARSAYPSKDAPFSVIKAFLDDRALKIEDRRQRKKAEIEYVRQNNGLGPAQQSMIVGGVEVMPGETFDEAILRIENSK